MPTKLKAFIYEDTESIYSSLIKMLNNIGFVVIHSETLNGAIRDLKSIKESGTKLDLVIIDLLVEGSQNGHQIMQECQDLGAHFKTIYTGHSQAEKERINKSIWTIVQKGADGMQEIQSRAKEAYEAGLERRKTVTPFGDQECKNIFSGTQVKPQSPIYVLGLFEVRKTFYSQQLRAFNLARALYESGRLTKDSKVCVVGGGVSGLTIATACAIVGSHVTLYERNASLLNYQRDANHRFLHPNIYDWPAEGSLEDDAKLPFLNWSANLASEVSTSIVDNFLEELVPILNGRLVVHYNILIAIKNAH